MYMILHSFLAHDTVKDYFYKNLLKERYYRFFFVSYAVGMLLPIVYIYSKAEKLFYFTPNMSIQILGYILILISSYAFYISFKNYNIREFLGLDRLNTDKKVYYPLKTEGINKYIRHPLYSFSYTLMLGIFLISPNNYVLIASIITGIYLPIGIFFEERKLIDEYGDSYKDYIKNVPMLIPKLW